MILRRMPLFTRQLLRETTPGNICAALQMGRLWNFISRKYRKAQKLLMQPGQGVQVKNSCYVPIDVGSSDSLSSCTQLRTPLVKQNQAAMGASWRFWTMSQMVCPCHFFYSVRSHSVWGPQCFNQLQPIEGTD